MGSTVSWSKTRTQQAWRVTLVTASNFLCLLGPSQMKSLLLLICGFRYNFFWRRAGSEPMNYLYGAMSNLNWWFVGGLYVLIGNFYVLCYKHAVLFRLKLVVSMNYLRSNSKAWSLSPPLSPAPPPKDCPQQCHQRQHCICLMVGGDNTTLMVVDCYCLASK